MKCFIKKFFIIYLLVTVILGCDGQFISVSHTSSLESTSPNAPSCSADCITLCRENFIDQPSYKKCTNLSDQDAEHIQRVLNNMKRGSWDSIQEDQLSLLVGVSYEPWIKYSQLNKRYTKKMMEWIGENEWTGDYLDSSGEVLKVSLAFLSYLSHDSGVLDGLKNDISKDKKMTFLELVSWEKNNKVFKKIHTMILDVCDDNSNCIQRVYCSQSSDIIIDTINKLDLTEDFVSQERFHRGICQ